MENEQLTFEFAKDDDFIEEIFRASQESQPIATVGFATKPMGEYEIAASEVGRLVAEKNKAYGSSFVDAAKIMAILYPDGIKPEQYEDATIMVRVIDKLKRVATDNDPFGEDPWEDITGYGLLSRVRRTHKRREAAHTDRSHK